MDNYKSIPFMPYGRHQPYPDLLELLPTAAALRHHEKIVCCRPLAVQCTMRMLNPQLETRMETELLLFGTSGCHLCDEATSLLECLENCEWRTVDIADDDTLIARYGTRIPVVQRPNGSEISWPFSKSELENFLKQ